MANNRRLIVAITGASGAAYAIRFLQAASSHYDDIYVTLSEQARQVINLETDRSLSPGAVSSEQLLGFPCPPAVPLSMTVW